MSFYFFLTEKFYSCTAEHMCIRSIKREKRNKRFIRDRRTQVLARVIFCEFFVCGVRFFSLHILKNVVK